MPADAAPPAMAEAVEDALIVLPVPMNTGEASEVQWLAVPPPPAGNGLADHPAALYLARLAPNSRQTISCILGGVTHTLSATPSGHSRGTKSATPRRPHSAHTSPRLAPPPPPTST